MIEIRKTVDINWLGDIEESVAEDVNASINSFVQKFQSSYSFKILDLELEQKPLVDDGNNFCSLLLLLKLRLLDDKNSESSKSVVFKVPKLATNYHLIREFAHFEKESHMYNEVLPQIAQYHGETFSPICYLAFDTGILFLENLKETSFDVQKDKNLLDKEHCIVVLRTLAQFHGSTVKYLQEHGTGIDNLTEEKVNKTHTFTDIVHLRISEFLQNIISSVPAQAYSKMEKQFINLSSGKFENLLGPNPNGLNVICHGDPWTNNFLFQYDREEVKKVKFIDFQMSRRSSPVSDFFYFFLTSVPFEVFYKNQESFVESYLKELNKEMEILECGIQFSRSEFDEHVKEHLINVILYTFGVIIPIIKSTTSAVQAEGGDKVEDLCKSQPYISLLTDWIHFLHEKTGFFDD